MNIHSVDNKDAWENFAILSKKNEFLQSFEWGEFQQAMGNTVFRFAFVENGKILNQVQGYEHTFSLGFSYLYIPRVKLSPFELDALCAYVKQNVNVTFIRLENNFEIYPDTFSFKKIKNRQWQYSLLLDLKLSQEELLGQMHSKSRYNIHLASRKEVHIVCKKDMDIFWELLVHTSKRDNIRLHDKGYYKKMLEMPGVIQYTAYYNGEALASALCIDYSMRRTYVHGASSNVYRNLMAPYLLQWHAIMDAKEKGMLEYDFGGIAPPQENGQVTQFHTLSWAANHALTGVTRFKAGFGGKVIGYADALEIPLKKGKYTLFQIFKKLRR